MEVLYRGTRKTLFVKSRTDQSGRPDGKTADEVRAEYLAVLLANQKRARKRTKRLEAQKREGVPQIAARTHLEGQKEDARA